MAQIRPERYTPLIKGYLTYSYDPKIASILLTERKDKRYIVEIDGIKFPESWLTKPLWEAIQKCGGKVSVTEKISTVGKTKIFGMTVEIRKITTKSKTEAIRIRVTGKTVTELILNIEKIKNSLAKWNIKPKVCLWDRSGNLSINLTTNKKRKRKSDNIVNENEIIKEQKRLKNAIEDLKDQVNSINSVTIKKTIREEKKVMQDILK